MDLTTIIGIVVGLALIIFGGIGADKIPNFIDSNSMFIVFGGTLCSGCGKFPMEYFKADGEAF